MAVVTAGCSYLSITTAGTVPPAMSPVNTTRRSPGANNAVSHVVCYGNTLCFPVSALKKIGTFNGLVSTNGRPVSPASSS